MLYTKGAIFCVWLEADEVRLQPELPRLYSRQRQEHAQFWAINLIHKQNEMSKGRTTEFPLYLNFVWKNHNHIQQFYFPLHFVIFLAHPKFMEGAFESLTISINTAKTMIFYSALQFAMGLFKGNISIRKYMGCVSLERTHSEMWNLFMAKYFVVIDSKEVVKNE